MGRRGQGEGSVYRDKDGRWRAQVELGWHGGKRQRKMLSGKTQAEVLDKRRKVLKALDEGALVAGKTPTVAAWLAHWLYNIAQPKLRASTFNRSYRPKVERHIVPALGRHRIDKLAPEHVERFYRALAKDGASPAQLLQIHRILSRALKVAVQRGVATRNVCTLIDAPSLVREKVRPLTRRQARAILGAARGRRNAARWTIALALGLRQGEALGLCWEYVDLEAETLTVRWSLERVPYAHGCAKAEACGLVYKPQLRARRCPKGSAGGLRLCEPKSESSKRTIALPGELIAELRAQRAAQAGERLLAGSAWVGFEGGDLVFAQADGKPIDPRRDAEIWEAILVEADVPHLKLHGARHTSASLLLEQGESLAVISELFGHSTLALTKDTYTSVSAELARKSAERMSAALWGEDVGATAVGEGLTAGSQVGSLAGASRSASVRRAVRKQRRDQR